MSDLQKLLNEKGPRSHAAYQRYEKSHGEAEARNTSRRRTLTDDERAWTTLDVDEDELRVDSGNAGASAMSMGHAQPLTAKVLTPSGFRLMGDIHAGDEVITLDGSATRVEDVYPQGRQPIYRVVFSDRSKTRTTADHLWRVRPEGEEAFRVMTLAEIMDEGTGRRFEVPPLGGSDGFYFETEDVRLAIFLEDAALDRGMMTYILPGLGHPWDAAEQQRLEDELQREMEKSR